MHIQPMSNTESFKGLSLKNAARPLKIAAVALPLALGAASCQQREDIFDKQETIENDLTFFDAIKNSIKERDNKIIQMRDSVNATKDSLGIGKLEKFDTTFTSFTESSVKQSESDKKKDKIPFGKMILYIATILFLLKLAMKEDEE